MTLTKRVTRAVFATALAAAVALIGLAAPAHAADAVAVAKLETELPAGTAEVWFSAEHGGAAASTTTLAVAADSAKPALETVSATTFGAGAVIPSDASRLVVYVASTVAVNPDISLTAVDSNGRILRIESARIALAANPATDLAGLTGSSTPIDLTPTDPTSPSTSAGGQSGKNAQTGLLGVMGGTIAWSIVVIAVLLIGAGATMIIIRRRQVRTTTEGAE